MDNIKAAKYIRSALWGAPAIWSVLYGITLFCLGCIASFGGKFELYGLPLQWLFQPPISLGLIVVGLLGVVTAFFNTHKLHIIFAFLNVFFWFNTALGFSFQLRVGSVVYLFLGLGGALWLLMRTMLDYRITLLFLRNPHLFL